MTDLPETYVAWLEFMKKDVEGLPYRAKSLKQSELDGSPSIEESYEMPKHSLS